MSTPKTDHPVQPLWRIIPMADFAPPPEPPQQAASRRLRAIWRLLRSDDTSAQAPARAERDLRSLPEVQLEHLVPPIAWREALPALDEALAGWLERESGSVRFLVGPPGCGLSEILTLWAAEHDWALVEPPSPEQVLSGGEDWLDAWPDTGGAPGWALPELERCYLRHAQGLTLIRRLFEAVTSGRRGPGLIACDSWAWAYLQRVWPIPASDVLTLQAFDGERLSAYFLQLANSTHRRLRVRNARTGEDLLPLPDEQGGDEASSRVSAELRQLAAHCRGNLRVAWTYWRTHLRTAPDPTEAGPDDSDATRQDIDTVWWSSGRAPALPVETGDELAYVLHALLLHNGLPIAFLDRLLPLSHAQIASSLGRLAQLGLVEQHGDRFCVAPLGYAATREFLRGRGYLVDAF